MRRYSHEGKEEKTQNKKKRQVSSDSSEQHSDKEENQDSKESPKKTNTEKKDIFVRNLSYDTTEDEVMAFFKKYGKINRVNLIQRDGRSKGMGFIEFENNADGEKLIKANEDLELDGRHLTVSWANDKKSPQDMTDAKTKTIFIGNLSFKTIESTIEDFFSDCGKVLAVRIAKQYDGTNKGFCHVDFEDEESVENALKKNGEELDGRNIKVDKTLPRNNNSDRRGGYGQGRDRDRGGFRGGRGYGNRGGYDRNNRDRGGYRRSDRSRDRD